MIFTFKDGHSLDCDISSLIDDLDDKISKETTRAKKAEADLQGNINIEASTRSNADTTLQSNIDNEISRATKVESTLTTNLSKEIQDRKDADTTLQSNLQSTIDKKVAKSGDIMTGNLSVPTISDTTSITLKEGGTIGVSGNQHLDITAMYPRFTNLQDSTSNANRPVLLVQEGDKAIVKAKSTFSYNGVTDTVNANLLNVTGSVTSAGTIKCKDITSSNNVTISLPSTKGTMARVEDINALDMTEIKPSASETISSVKQVDGKVSVSKQSISISQNQINDAVTGSEVDTMLEEVFK